MLSISTHINRLNRLIKELTKKVTDLTTKVNSQNSSSLPYLVYSVLLNQSGTNAPVATVLQNTLGAIPVFTRTNAGRYNIASPGLFPEGKTFITLTFYSADIPAIATWDDSGNISIRVDVMTVAPDGLGGYILQLTGSDDFLYNASLEIRVYP